MALRVMTLDVAPHRKGDLVDMTDDSPYLRWSQPVGGVEDLDPETQEFVQELADEREGLTDGPSEDQPDTDQPDTPDEPKGGNRSSKGRRGSSD